MAHLRQKLAFVSRWGIQKAAQTQSDRILLIIQDDGPRRKGKSLAEA